MKRKMILLMTAVITACIGMSAFSAELEYTEDHVGSLYYEVPEECMDHVTESENGKSYQGDEYVINVHTSDLDLTDASESMQKLYMSLFERAFEDDEKYQEYDSVYGTYQEGYLVNARYGLYDESGTSCGMYTYIVWCGDGIAQMNLIIPEPGNSGNQKYEEISEHIGDTIHTAGWDEDPTGITFDESIDLRSSSGSGSASNSNDAGTQTQIDTDTIELNDAVLVDNQDIEIDLARFYSMKGSAEGDACFDLKIKNKTARKMLLNIYTNSMYLNDDGAISLSLDGNNGPAPGKNGYMSFEVKKDDGNMGESIRLDDLFQLNGTINVSYYSEDGTYIDSELNREYEVDFRNLQTGLTAGQETIAEDSSTETSSLISVAGIYYGDLYVNQEGNCYSDQKLDGYEDCIIVFDFSNDAMNRIMPESKLEQPGHLYTNDFTCPDITLTVNGANTYEAYDPNAYENHYSNALNKYTSYKNPIGYGNLLGGADTVRMYSVFYVNPNELTEESTAVLTVMDQSVEFNFADIHNITYPDELLSCEDNYEQLQQIAAFKWRLDKMLDLANDVDHYMASMNPGSDLSGIGDSIKNLFSDDYGVTISGLLSSGFSPDHTFDGMNTSLPHFNINILTSSFPDQADDIVSFVDSANQLGSMVQDTGYSKSDVENLLKDIIGYDANLSQNLGTPADIGDLTATESAGSMTVGTSLDEENVVNTETILKLQTALNEAGYNCGTPDGVAGSNTYSAMHEFQEDHGLSVTDDITSELLKKLGIS